MHRKMASSLLLLPFALALAFGWHLAAGRASAANLALVEADSKNIQYTGRIDFSDPKKPRFWSPGVSVKARFRGPECQAMINDEVLYGKSHNYVEVAVDNQKPVRIQLTGKVNVVPVASGLTGGAHTVTLCKDTEAGIGYLEFVGFRCAGLLPPPPKSSRKLEFIGDSITCGAGSDQSVKPCGQGEWYDQHNAYASYGPTTAHTLGAQYHLTSVSGIGLMHSCCDMKTVMPEVWDKMNLSGNSGTWDFHRYQPNAVTVCLGQNDGEQNQAALTAAYGTFIAQIRAAYPQAQIVLLDSPMADSNLIAYQKKALTAVVSQVHASGDANVHAFFFSRSFNGGCGGHPDMAQHQIIAAELSGYLKPLMGW